VATEYQGTDDLYSVAITVTWLEGLRPYSVTVQTMLDGSTGGTGTLSTTTTGTGGEQTR
jgi:hypothetical protein